ncbi:MAG: DUF4238 domain-containing protein [Methanobacterium sp.]
MTARHHHYLSQCYLKGFTKGGSKKSKLTVVDFKEKKRFETIPRNVGGIRDFNRIDVKGFDQNVLEKSLSEFEGEAASALSNLEESLDFQGETKSLILNLIALLAARSPQRREHWSGFQTKILENIMELSLADKERWESQIRQMKESGKEVNDNLSYEDMKRFHDSKEYDITFAREHHINMEFVVVEAILPYLDHRNWLLIKATDESGPFITTDNPVILTWNEPEKIPPFYRNSPGYGMRNTQVYFPVSRNIALVGEFEGRLGVIDGTSELVAALNSKMLAFTYKQVYSSKIGFYFHGRNGELLEGTQLLRNVGV